jgi:outer membrane protein assembly factor BamB
MRCEQVAAGGREAPDQITQVRRWPLMFSPCSRRAAVAARTAGGAVLLVVLVAFCPEPPAAADDWPQWRGPERDGVWRETGLIDTFAGPTLDTKWSAPIGAGYCGPTVSDGRVVVMDRLTDPEEVERVLCFDAESGRPLWVHPYPCSYADISYTAGPRASVTLEAGRGWALGSTGHLHCLELATGQVVWQRDLRQEYAIRMPEWGIAAAPLIVGELVILHIGGTPGATVVALEKGTGRERWRALDDRASYSAPILVQQGDRPVVIVWNGDALVGLAPATGETYWRIPFPPRNMPIGVPTPVVAGRRVFVSSFYDGSLMVELDAPPPAARTLWSIAGRNERDTRALHCMISTPVFLGDHVYGVDSYGELRCLDAASGTRIWEDRTATPRARWSNIHMVQQADRIWMFNERGELIIARLSPAGFTELSRAKLIEPTRDQLDQRGGVCWSHPAFANRHVYARNDQQLVCVSLARE